MKDILKNTAKLAIGICFILGAVAVVTSSNVGKSVSTGFKGAKSAVEE